jgi:hypothetical protein
MSAVLSTISGLLGKVVEPIAKLIGDERFTAQEKAELVNAELLAELANERAAFEIEKLEWVATSEKEKRLAAYLMTLMLLIDQVWTMLGHDRFFGNAMLAGYFSLLGLYVAGRSVEKWKRK